MIDWRLDIVTERDKRPTKRGAVASATSRSSAKRRGEAKQKGAPARDKKTRQLIEDPGFAERPQIARSLTGSDDQNFSRNLVHQAVAAQCPDYSASDQQVGATLAAMAAMQPADALEGMVGCRVFIRDHHVGYIDWATYEENRRMMRRNSVNWEGDEAMAAIRAGQG